MSSHRATGTTKGSLESGHLRKGIETGGRWQDATPPAISLESGHLRKGIETPVEPLAQAVFRQELESGHLRKGIETACLYPFMGDRLTAC